MPRATNAGYFQLLTRFMSLVRNPARAPRGSPRILADNTQTGSSIGNAVNSKTEAGSERATVCYPRKICASTRKFALFAELRYRVGEAIVRVVKSSRLARESWAFPKSDEPRVTLPDPKRVERKHNGDMQKSYALGSALVFQLG
jgi:hypothetical protein